MTVEAAGLAQLGSLPRGCVLRSGPATRSGRGDWTREPGRVGRPESRSVLQKRVAPPPSPSAAARGSEPAPVEPQPFPGGGPGGCGDTPAPAPTGARRAQECSRPDSPAPPSYLRRPSIKRCWLPPSAARPAAPPGSPARSARSNTAQVRGSPTKVGAAPAADPRARRLPRCPGTTGLERKVNSPLPPGAFVSLPFPEDWQALAPSAYAARTGAKTARMWEGDSWEQGGWDLGEGWWPSHAPTRGGHWVGGSG